MSFWRTFGFQTISQVETILDREHFTLEELMDEEELLQECKSHNKKLIEYLTKPDTLVKLINLLTQEPDETADLKRRSKYPFVACELLCSEVWAIYDAIFENEALLDDLYSYLETPPPLNPLLVAYVSKVAGVLLQKKGHESINYLKKKGEVIFTNFLKHLDNASVTELLIKVIGCEAAESHGILQWLSDAQLISKLIQKLNISSPAEVHENAAQTLVDVIAVSGNSHSPLLSQIESPESIGQLIETILAPGDNAPVLSSGLTILMELFKRSSQENLNTESDLQSLPPVYPILVKNLEKFTKLLLEPAQQEPLTLTIGTIVPLGITRLKIVEFILCLIKTNFACLHHELVRSGVISACLDLFFTYVWNNFLHATVDCILATIFDGENQDLKIALIKDCRLLDRIVNASKENDEAVAQPRGMRRGNMAFVTRISNLLCLESQRNEPLQKLLEEHEEWNVFVNTALARTQQIESPIGHKPLHLEPTSTSEEEDEPFGPNGNPATLVFTQYLAQQGFTNVYPDDYNDEYDDGEGERYFDADNYESPEMYEGERAGEEEENDSRSGGSGSGEGHDHSGSSDDEFEHHLDDHHEGESHPEPLVTQEQSLNSVPSASSTQSTPQSLEAAISALLLEPPSAQIPPETPTPPIDS